MYLYNVYSIYTMYTLYKYNVYSIYTMYIMYLYNLYSIYRMYIVKRQGNIHWLGYQNVQFVYQFSLESLYNNYNSMQYQKYV